MVNPSYIKPRAWFLPCSGSVISPVWSGTTLGSVAWFHSVSRSCLGNLRVPQRSIWSGHSTIGLNCLTRASSHHDMRPGSRARCGRLRSRRVSLPARLHKRTVVLRWLESRLEVIVCVRRLDREVVRRMLRQDLNRLEPGCEHARSSSYMRATHRCPNSRIGAAP